MFRVYWSEDDVPMAETYEDMGVALKRTEALRKRQREGETVSFIGMVSEVPGNVTKMGVEDPPPGYEWKKRRI